MQELPELENSKLKDLIGGIALTIYNCYKQRGGIGIYRLPLYPVGVYFCKFKDITSTANGKFLVYKTPYGKNWIFLANSTKRALESKGREFAKVIEKLFEDTSGNKTINVEVSDSDKFHCEVSFLGDIETAKIIKYIKDRIS